ncbi:apoptosis facilitator Bcl-2-like protein 14 [Spea bombifrons]|uniref:apoptosis facilitator Bcl-2-like protein 14 n=1 Tax=Spea bombifrons TaxID=233779 RepID=UPI00234AF000|nr:apoptosis facilitator Bcl-2-like protein 14 [Spea bombifrons]
MAVISDGALDEIPLQGEDSPEFRILMAYASRSLPASKLRRLQGLADGSEEDSDAKRIPGTEDLVARNEEDRKGHETSKVSKKKKKKKWLRRMTPKCLKAAEMRAQGGEGDTNFENVVAGKLRRIVTSQLRKTKSEKVVFRTLSVEEDGDDDDALIKQLVTLLRDEGDKLDEKIRENKTLLQQFRQAFSYVFLEGLANVYVTETVPDSEPEPQVKKVAMCCDLVAKLTALEVQPMNRVLGFGARYMQSHYATFIQSQGGWEEFAKEIHPDEEVE